VLSACNFKGYMFDGETACKCFPCFSGEWILKSTLSTVTFYRRYTRALTCQRLSQGVPCKHFVGDNFFF